METPDFEFVYSDCDVLANEIAEWYTYSEEPEFQANSAAFKKYFEHIRKGLLRLIQSIFALILY